MFRSQAMRRVALQQHIAAASSKLLEDPEGNLPSLRALLELTLDEDTVVCCHLPCSVLIRRCCIARAGPLGYI